MLLSWEGAAAALCVATGLGKVGWGFMVSEAQTSWNTAALGLPMERPMKVWNSFQTLTSSSLILFAIVMPGAAI